MRLVIHYLIEDEGQHNGGVNPDNFPFGNHCTRQPAFSESGRFLDRAANIDMPIPVSLLTLTTPQYLLMQTRQSWTEFNSLCKKLLPYPQSDIVARKMTSEFNPVWCQRLPLRREFGSPPAIRRHCLAIKLSRL